MIKPASLRAAIMAAAPELKAAPDKLLVFADAGNIVATSTSTPSFEYRYTLNLILTDFAGDADQVFIALLAWVMVNESELVDNSNLRKTAISFEVDHLNQDTCDLSIKLPLSEAVRVTRDAAGAYQATHDPEQAPEWRTVGLVAP
jgi:uncharacterized lipoprotein YmbA